MRFLETNNHQLLHARGGDGDSAPGNHLHQIRSDADRLLAAGDDAIRKVLSGDAQAFLRSGRQQSGQ